MENPKLTGTVGYELSSGFYVTIAERDEHRLGMKGHIPLDQSLLRNRTLNFGDSVTVDLGLTTRDGHPLYYAKEIKAHLPAQNPVTEELKL